MLEKVGAPLLNTERNLHSAVRCAENVAQRWMWEHQERGLGNTRISFPGDSSLPQSLMPTAIWLGAREYGGIWLHGGGGGRYDEREVFGFLGDGRLVVLSEAAGVFWGGSYSGRVFGAFWYRNRFMHWAINLVRFWSRNRVEFVMEQSRQGQETMWCGLEGCPYPYVTMSPVGLTAYEHLDQSMARESRVAEIEIRRDIRPQWGAFVTDRRPVVRNLNRDGDEAVEEENFGNGGT